MTRFTIISILLLTLSLTTACAALQVPEVATAARELNAARELGACESTIIRQAENAYTSALVSQIEREGDLAKWQALTSIANSRLAISACEPPEIIEGDCPMVPQVNGAANVESYTVARGDCLWNIAKKPSIYNDPFLWPLICHANGLHNCDLIHPNDVLNIPDSGDFPIEQLNAVRRSAGARQ